MEGVVLYTLPRVLHVLGVVVWIGGVGMVATVVLPLLRQEGAGAAQWRLFQGVVRCFINYARLAVLVVGLSGFHMLGVLKAWGRFADPSYWWMYAMVAVWTLFFVVLFILQPLASRRGETPPPADTAAAFRSVHRVHWLLLLVSLLTVAGAVSGAHGWLWF